MIIIKKAQLAQSTGVKAYDVKEERLKISTRLTEGSLVITNSLKKQIQDNLNSAEVQMRRFAKLEKMGKEVKKEKLIEFKDPSSNKVLQAKLVNGKYVFSEKLGTKSSQWYRIKM